MDLGRRRWPARASCSAPCRLRLCALILAAVTVGTWPATAGGPEAEPQPLAPLQPARIPADFEGQIRHVVLQACRDTVADLVPPYRGLLRHLPPDVQVTIVADDEATVALLQGRLGSDLGGPLGRVQFAVVNRGITVWARDRMIAARSAVDPERTVLIVPDVRSDLEVERLNDAEAIPAAVAGLTPERVAIRRVHLLIEGGNILASRTHVFVGRNAIQDNIRPSMPTPRAVRRALQDVFGKPVIVLGETFPEDLPSEHADMYLTIIDDRTVLVGRRVEMPAGEEQPPAPPGVAEPFEKPITHRDPVTALLGANRFLAPFALPTWTPAAPRRAGTCAGERPRQTENGAAHPGVARPPGGANRPPAGRRDRNEVADAICQPLRDPCDLVAEEMAGRGFRVLRIPIHPDRGGADFITFNNALLEERQGRKMAYVPSYGLPSLEREARRVYTYLGFQVRLIDVRAIHRLEGTVRCLANVIERTEGGRWPPEAPASRPAQRGAAIRRLREIGGQHAASAFRSVPRPDLPGRVLPRLRGGTAGRDRPWHTSSSAVPTLVPYGLRSLHGRGTLRPMLSPRFPAVSRW